VLLVTEALIISASFSVSRFFFTARSLSRSFILSLGFLSPCRDRTAFISTVKDGTPSYVAQMSNVANNFIIANYGASQGFDTDDGSSWYDIHDNFFFMADAWKMDYGGHDSRFTDNVIYHAHNDGQVCVCVCVCVCFP
jgi:hypothetical protein